MAAENDVKSAVRVGVRFTSGATECAAWHYPGTNGGCVVMTGGFAVTKEPGTDRFAAAFQEAGFTVLAFDHRHLGGSGGSPRQVAPVGEQLSDWRAALGFATTLPGVDPARLAIWGFSVSGGHVVRVAASWPGLAGAIAQTPNVDGLATARNAARWTAPSALLRLTARGLLDAVRGLVGADPLLVPLVGEPGTVALLSTPDALADGDRALDPDGRYRGWVQAVAARSALAVTAYRPGRDAPRVRCPLLVVVAEQDRSAPPGPAVRAAAAAPRGELVRVPGGHYTAFLDGYAQTVAAELTFLRRTLLTG